MKTETETQNSNGDLIYRQDAIEAVWKPKVTPNEFIFDALKTAIESEINNVPSAESEPLSQDYARTVWTWLLDYQIKSADLEGRYSPYEVLSWVANDWRKDNGLDK